MKIDLRGAECPEPLYKVARAISQAEEGSVIEVLVDSKLCVEMIVDMVEATGSGDAEVSQADGYTVIKIRVKRS